MADGKIGICGECRYWGDPEEDQPEDFVKKCMAIKHRSRASAWNFYLDTEEEEIAAARAKDAECIASTLDASDYRSCLRTRNDFGCVLFERGDQ